MDRVSTELWEATSAVLESVAGGDDVLAAGLRELRVLVGADRADAGPVRRTDLYRPTVVDTTLGLHASAVSVPVDDPLVLGVLGAPHAVLVPDVNGGLPLGPCRQALVAAGTRAMVVRKLEWGGQVRGLLCLDWVTPASHPGTEVPGLVDELVTAVLQPLLAMRPHAPRPPAGALSRVEREVAGLAARGLSYRQIARETGRSPNTIDHQLLSARRKLGARNTAELVRLLQL